MRPNGNNFKNYWSPRWQYQEVCNFVGLWMHIFSQSRGGVKMTLRQLAAAQLALIMGVVATAASTGSSSCFALPATATDAGAFAANENVQL